MLLLLLSAKLSAQVVEKQLPSADKFDTVSILRLIKEGSILMIKSQMMHCSILSHAEEQSKQLNFTKGLALSNAKIARWYFGNNSDKSIEYSRKALHYFERAIILPSTDEKADVHLLLAETFDEQGKQDSSAYYYYLLSNEIESGNISDAKLAVDLYTKLAIFWINLDYGNSENDEYFVTLRNYVDKAKQAARSLKDSKMQFQVFIFCKGLIFMA